MATDDSLIRAVSPNGQTLWAVDPGGRPSAAMALQGNLIYFPTSQGDLTAYSTDGHLAWRTPLHSNLSTTPAVAADGTVYEATVSGRVYALGQHGIVLWSFNTGDPIVTSPVIGRSGWIFVASTHNLYALSPHGVPSDHHPTAQYGHLPHGPRHRRQHLLCGRLRLSLVPCASGRRALALDGERPSSPTPPRP